MAIQKIKYSFVLLLVLLASACGDPEETTNQIGPLGPLVGYHTLTSILCECFPIEVIPHKQQWKFDFDDKEIDVVVDGVVENGPVLEQGVYTFEVVDTTQFGNAARLLRLNTNRGFYYTEDSDVITLADPGAEFDAGSYYEFEKN